MTVMRIVVESSSDMGDSFVSEVHNGTCRTLMRRNVLFIFIVE